MSRVSFDSFPARTKLCAKDHSLFSRNLPRPLPSVARRKPLPATRGLHLWFHLLVFMEKIIRSGG
jgi:hypothetical protein